MMNREKQQLAREESALLNMMAAGESDAAIEEILQITPGERNDLLGRLKAKLGADTRMELLVIGLGVNES